MVPNWLIVITVAAMAVVAVIWSLRRLARSSDSPQDRAYREHELVSTDPMPRQEWDAQRKERYLRKDELSTREPPRSVK